MLNMLTKKKYMKPIEIGDLVTHVLMDEEWLGVVVEIKTVETELGEKSKALIHLSSRHVFSKPSRQDPGIPKKGWVDIDWLEIKSRAKEADEN